MTTKSAQDAAVLSAVDLSSRTRALPSEHAESERIEERPASFSQQGLWLAHQLSSNPAMYNSAHGFRIRGDLRSDALERAIREIVRRHSTLRTRFAVSGDTIVQRIQPEVGQVLERINQPPGVDLNLDVLAKELVSRAFRLGQEPLFRAVLIKVAPRDHAFLFVAHHLICDGWSMTVFLREFSELYSRLAAENCSPLPGLPIQYSDYAERQGTASDPVSEGRQLTYWKGKLAGAPGRLDFLGFAPRSSLEILSPGYSSFPIEGDLQETIRSLARRQKATPFMIFLAAWAALLFRLTGYEDLVIGAPVSGRFDPELESVIGPFADILPLRIQVAPTFSFEDLSAQVRQTCLEAYSNQGIQFEKIIRELRLVRDSGPSPYSQLMISYVESPGFELALRELDVEAIRLPSVPQFELALMIYSSPRGWYGEIFSGPSIVVPELGSRLGAHFEELLKSICEDPRRRISELSVFDEREREELAGWNRTEKEYGERGCIHELIEEQVKRSPDGVAVVYEQEQVSYEELNRQANIWAHRLRREGVGPETVVGVHLERSVELVVALLAVMKAGGAYLPLDPGYPEQRLKYMVEDAGVEVVVTEPGLGGKLPGSVRQIWIEGGVGEAGQEQSEAESGVEAGNLVYVIYTSGSTGQPKGVGNTHRGLVNRLSWMQSEYELRGSDRVLQKTPFSFDVSFWEFFWPLVNGGVLIVARPEGHRDPKYLTEVMENEEVTLAHFVPSMLGAFLEHGEVERCGSLRKVFCSGEELGAELGRRFFARSEAELHNLYGPTEAAIEVTYRECRKEGEGVIPIGRPIANTQVYVLDREMRQRPVGVSGELYIGGVGLARGYMNRADLTAERFVPDPYGGEGGRLYRTGDLARWRADGEIEFLGRMDHQIKLRGYRIELGEIEEVLKKHEGVQEAIVMDREDGPEQKRLVAYVVAKQGREVSVDELRMYLQQKLPQYMVPSAFVMMGELPLTGSGKVDRRGLPEPEKTGQGEQRHHAPSNPREEIVAAIWAEVLGCERVGIEDNFFELGGHSLMAMRVMARVQEAFGRELPLRMLFERPTVKGLVEGIWERAEVRGTTAPDIRTVVRGEEVPLSHAQERLWFLDQLVPGNPFYNVPLAVRLSGELNEEALRAGLREVVKRHEVLRTHFEVVGGVARQVISDEVEFAVTVIDLEDWEEGEREKEIQRLAQQEAEQAFDLMRGPLLRARLIGVGKQDHVLLLTMHHIVSDGWSMGVMVKEVAALYEAFCQGQPSPLPKLPIQYADYAVWQREWLSGEVLEEQLAYWKRQLSGVPVLQLPSDYPRPAIQSYRGASEKFELGEELTARLRELSRREGVTLYMTLLAAFDLLLAHYTDQTDIALGTDIAGRNHPQVEPLIGFFVNQLVLRNRVAGDLTFRELLKQVRETTVEAYEHQDIPFEMVVKELRPERDLSHSPLFQVKFLFQDAIDGGMQMDSLRITALPNHHGSAKFDLTMLLGERDGKLGGTVEYCVELFTPQSVRRLVELYQHVLQEIARDADQSCYEISVLDTRERAHVLVTLNDTSVALPRARRTDRSFVERVSSTPDAIALACEEEHLSYEELNRRSNRLANYLLRAGIRREVPVAICMERSPDLIISLLAVVKAGAFYVPIDPNYPLERIDFILNDTHAPLLLTQRGVADRLPATWAVLVSVDSISEELEREPSTEPDVDIDPEQLIYVIYTSGSTGEPKGVCATHRGVSNLCSALTVSYQTDSESTMLQFASFSFDAATTEWTISLLVGGKLQLLTEAGPIAGPLLADFITRHAVTVLTLPPSVLGSMSSCSMPTVKTLAVAGEACPTSLVKRWSRELRLNSLAASSASP